MIALTSVLALLLLVCTTSAFAPPANVFHPKVVTARMASTTNDEYYIDDQRRMVMNLLMVGAGGLSVAGFGLPFLLFFYPQGTGGGPSTIPARDAVGRDIYAKQYLATKPANDRSLAQGLKGDPTYDAFHSKFIIFNS